MNTRCFRCGWSFSLSRETIENAVANAGNQKIHVEYCPRCRQVIKIPIQQLKRALPAGWTPEGREQAEETVTDTAASEMPAASEVPAAAPARDARPEAASKPEGTGQRPRRRKAQDRAAPETPEEASPATKTKTQTASRTGRPATTKAAAKRTTKKAARKSTDT